MARKDTVVLIAQPGQQFKTRLPDDLHTRLKAAAAWSNRSTNAEIIHRLEASFQAEGNDGALRDQFAMAALAGLVTVHFPGPGANGDMAKAVYAIADAMIAERSRP